MYTGPGGADDPRALGVSPDGSSVFVTALSVGSTNDYATIGYDATTGDQLWVSRYDGPGGGEDQVYALAVGPDGSTVVVTGTDYSSDTFQDYATIAYSAASGDQLWIARYTSPNYNLDEATAVAVSPDGSAVFVTGYSWHSPDLDYATMAYDLATGEQRWISRYDKGHELASALGVSPDGSRVYVTGYSSWKTSYDYATVAYDAGTGGPIWASRTALESQELALALAVSPDGSSVFVTGYANLAEFRSGDFLTMAYPG
jgi:hypothetical protein